MTFFVLPEFSSRVCFKITFRGILCGRTECKDTYRMSSHQNHQHSLFLRYRIVRVQCNWNLHKPKSHLGTEALQCRAEASLYVPCSSICSF